MTQRPIIRLRPKIRFRRYDGPWAFADQIVLDRRSRALAAGTVVTLEDAERRPLATGTVNPASKIALRVLDWNPEAQIDGAWLRARLQAALELRERLFGAPFYRLVHAEGDGLPGLIIDRFGDTAVLQPNAAWAEARYDELAAALIDVTGIKTLVKNASGRARALEGLDEESAVTHGAVDGLIPVPMNGATYMADLLGGQKTGLFYDQRPNHAFAARLAKGARVLDVFSHVGGFSLAALAGGAASALAVDGSAAALDLATQGAEVSGVADKFATRQGDAFAVMSALKEEGAVFDVTVCDPPAFAPHKGALEAGLRAYEKVAKAGAELTVPGGYLVLCSCSHAADLDKFRTASLRGVGRARRTAQVIATGGAGPDHPVHSALAETSYLKAIFLRLD